MRLKSWPASSACSTSCCECDPLIEGISSSHAYYSHTSPPFMMMPRRHGTEFACSLLPPHPPLFLLQSKRASDGGVGHKKRVGGGGGGEGEKVRVGLAVQQFLRALRRRLLNFFSHSVPPPPQRLLLNSFTLVHTRVGGSGRRRRRRMKETVVYLFNQPPFIIARNLLGVDDKGYRDRESGGEKCPPTTLCGIGVSLQTSGQIRELLSSGGESRGG